MGWSHPKQPSLRPGSPRLQNDIQIDTRANAELSRLKEMISRSIRDRPPTFHNNLIQIMETYKACRERILADARMRERSQAKLWIEVIDRKIGLIMQELENVNKAREKEPFGGSEPQETQIGVLKDLFKIFYFELLTDVVRHKASAPGAELERDSVQILDVLRTVCTEVQRLTEGWTLAVLKKSR